MMKKSLIICVLLLMAGLTGVSAQSIQGKWKSTGAIKKALAEGYGSGGSGDFFLTIGERDISIAIVVKYVESELTLDLEFSTNGTYTRSGNEMKAEVGDRLDFKILDIQSSNPELKPVLAVPALKAQTIKMVEEEMRKKDDMPDFKDVKDTFSKFTILSVTLRELKLKVDNIEEPFEYVGR